MVNSLYLWCTSKCHLVPIDMFIRVGPISPKCSRRLFRRGARLESKRVQVFLDGATSHEPPTRLRFELESKQDFCCRRNQERDFCTAKNNWGFFYQDSFKEPPDFWGLQMLVSVKVQPPSEVGTTTFPPFALWAYIIGIHNIHIRYVDKPQFWFLCCRCWPPMLVWGQRISEAAGPSQLGHLRDFYTTPRHKSTEAFSLGAGTKAALKTCHKNRCVSDPWVERKWTWAKWRHHFSRSINQKSLEDLESHHCHLFGRGQGNAYCEATGSDELDVGMWGNRGVLQVLLITKRLQRSGRCKECSSHRFFIWCMHLRHFG